MILFTLKLRCFKIYVKYFKILKKDFLHIYRKSEIIIDDHVGPQKAVFTIGDYHENIENEEGSNLNY